MLSNKGIIPLTPIHRANGFPAFDSLKSECIYSYWNMLTYILVLHTSLLVVIWTVYTSHICSASTHSDQFHQILIFKVRHAKICINKYNIGN